MNIDTHLRQVSFNFIHDIVLPKLLPKKMYPITKVNFVFANAFFSPLFTPVLYRYIDPLTFLKFIKPHTLDKQNPRERSTFRSCARAIVLPMVEEDPEHSNYRTRRIMHQLSIANLGEDYNPEHDISFSIILSLLISLVNGLIYLPR